MNKIMVIGVSSGAGKSTFARSLGEKLQIPVHHLDTLYWMPSWVETPPEEFIAHQEKIVREPKWIIEGNYTGTFNIRLNEADTIIYLELPLLTCLYRVVKRRIQYHGKTRPDMTVGCPEKIDWDFIKFILTTYSKRRRMMAERFEVLRKEKDVIVLKSTKEIKSFLEVNNGKNKRSTSSKGMGRSF